MTITAPASPQVDRDGRRHPRLVHPRPVRHVHPLGAVRPAGPARVGEEPRADHRRGLPEVLRPLRPDLFDAADWARRAREAGMKYVVLTTKHHEGFALWDSALTDYKSTNTPFGRDIVREFVDAVRAEGCGSASTTRSSTGTTPTSPSTGCTRGGTTATRRSLRSTRAATWPGTAVPPRSGDGAVVRLRADRLPVLRLLVPRQRPRGHLGGKGRDDWGSEELLELTRRLQPGIIVNDRLDLPATS